MNKEMHLQHLARTDGQCDSIPIFPVIVGINHLPTTG